MPHGQAVSVHGRSLLRGGAVFVPRGVQIVGLVAPDQALKGEYAVAHRHFSVAELRRALAFHVNTIRFQISQYGLDPQNVLYSHGYAQEVEAAVRAATNLGLAVILSVQAERPAGAQQRCPLPNAGTLRVWNDLATTYRADRGVMFELYNEPKIAPTALGWGLWKYGGQVSDGAESCHAVGMQHLIDAIRSRGARNVIIVPGADLERTMAGIPFLTDPGSPADPQLAYGIHYPPLLAGWPVWRELFGVASASVPVIVTEWNADSTDHCLPSEPGSVPVLLNYLESKSVGVVGFAFDLPGTIISNWAHDPTSYGNFQCGVPGGGPGQLLFGQFAAEANSGAG